MRQRRLMNQINVVPYIDVMLVLLVIFMVTAPMIQSGSVDLPSVAKSAQTAASPLEVVVHADGSLGLRDHAEGGEEQAIEQAELIEIIHDAVAADPERAVVIAGDKKAQYEAVLKVMDTLQRQNVGRISLLVHSNGR